MSEVSKFRWGILGTGKIAQDFATALAHLPDVEIVAVGSRNQQSAEEFGKRFNISKRYASYEQLAEDPNVDIVYVSTLHPLHKSCSILCLNSGKHVLSEKPLTINAKEAIEVIHLARQKKLFYMEGMWTRFFPAIVKLKELIQEGILGDIKVVMADFGFKNPGVDRLSKPELGGGAILDIGVYPISLSSLVFGGVQPSVIKALAYLGPTGVDEQAAVTLRYASEQFANLTFTLLADTPKEAIIVGNKGRVRIHAPFWCSTKLTLTIGDKPDEVLEFPLPKTREHDKFNFTNSIGMYYQALHVHQMLREGRLESNVIPLDESLVIMKIMDEVRSQIGVKYSYE